MLARIGIDLGGTKIEGVGLHESGRELTRCRIHTPVGDYIGTVAAIAGLVERVEAEIGARGCVGIGIPGAISPATGLVKNANSTWLNGQPLDRDLVTALGRPVRIENDANCFAVSEATDGSGAGATVVFGVILGTGVGAGIVVRGRPLRGANAIAGEWGHNPLSYPQDDERPGPPCYCGRNGCIETFLSGPALASDHRARTGQICTPAAIAAAAASGDQRADATLARYEARLARALATVINLLDPEVIVLGGGLSNIDRLYRTVPSLWRPFILSDQIDTKLVPAVHGDASGVRGAAWLWPPGEGRP